MADTIPCAGGIVFDDAGRLLLIRRANAPGAGLWSVPGGRCRPGESAADACVREVAEETGLHVRILRPAGTVGPVLRDGPAGLTYAIDDFLCAVVDGSLLAGDDAQDARWATSADLTVLPLVPGLVDALTEWGLLPG